MNLHYKLKKGLLYSQVVKASTREWARISSKYLGATLASAGAHSQIVSTDQHTKLASAGPDSYLISRDYYAALASAGDDTQLTATGHKSSLASSGSYARLTATGDMSTLVAAGYGSQLDISGKNSVGAALRGDDMIRGSIGTWIVLAEWGVTEDKNTGAKTGFCKCVRAAQIDGKKLKPNTWYTLTDGEFVEVNEKPKKSDGT